MPRAWRDRKRRVTGSGRRRRCRATGSLGADTDLWIWLASAALSVAVGFRFFGHYYLQLLPPLCLLSAGVLATRSRRLVKATVVFASVSRVSFSLLGFWVKPWGDSPRYQMVSQYLDTHTSVSDHIFVWGHMPEIYWASDRRPASRFITSGFPVGDWGSRPAGDVSTERTDAGRVHADDGRPARPPTEYVLDTSPAAFRGSQYSPMSKYPELRQFVDSRYEYVETIDGIAIYRARHPEQAIDRH